MPTASRIQSILVTLLTLGGGAAALAIGSYATDHQAEEPLVFGLILLAVRELSKYLQPRDQTRAINPPK